MVQTAANISFINGEDRVAKLETMMRRLDVVLMKNSYTAVTTNRADSYWGKTNNSTNNNNK